jgi:hypothetical protein
MIVLYIHYFTLLGPSNLFYWLIETSRTENTFFSAWRCMIPAGQNVVVHITRKLYRIVLQQLALNLGKH